VDETPVRLTSMRLTHLKPADYKRMPWKNGGGMTTEIMAEPGPSGTFDWRLSIAEVAQSGPFSDFSGYDRTIMLIEGVGFALDFDKAPSKRIDRPYEPFPFAGEWKADCTLIDGPIRDFNLMAARERIAARLEILRPAEAAATSPSKTLIIHALRGAVAAQGETLAAGDTLRIDSAAAPVEITGDDAAIAVLVRIEPR
jgi:environmental stress-induced protein Ves